MTDLEAAYAAIIGGGDPEAVRRERDILAQRCAAQARQIADLIGAAREPVRVSAVLASVEAHVDAGLGLTTEALSQILIQHGAAV